MWPNPEREGYPLNPEEASHGHVIRVDGRIDIYSWDPLSKWWTDPKERWVAPEEAVRDNDEYLGQLKEPPCKPSRDL